MELDLRKLIDLLQKEYNVYQKVYELSREKQQTIINEDIGRLNEIVKLEEDYLAQISELESDRESLTGVQRISQLFDNYNDNRVEILKKIQQKLTGLLETLREQNELNDRLLDDALRITNISINALTNNNGKSTYGRDSKLKYTQKNIINKRA